ncbi:MAG: hypothetical protein ACTHJU_03470, partial [Sphingopyxis sp.]
GYDVRTGLVTPEGARRYGVVIDADGVIDAAATTALRDSMAKQRGPAPDFTFGPSIAELKARCREETGLEPPKDPVTSPIALAWFRRQGLTAPQPHRAPALN